MKFIKNYKKQSYIIAFIAIALALAISGASYAYFFQVKSNSNLQQVKTGNLTVTSSVSNTSTSESELLPISDSDATTGTDGYLTSTVSISNTGTLASSYNLIIDYDIDNLPDDKTSSDLLSQSYIGYAVFKVDGENKTLVTNGTLGDCSLLSDSSTARIVLSNQKLAKSGSEGSSVTYEVRIWIKDTASIDVIGKVIYLNTYVVGTVDSDAELAK